MDSPVFLEKEQVVEIHEVQISFFGGDRGISDAGLLESAVLAPMNHFFYTQTKNLFDLAACYAFHLVKNHPFIDGNKRVALAAALTFLATNGISVQIKQAKLYRAVLGLTTSRMDKSQFSEMLRDHSPLEFSFMANYYVPKHGQKL